MVLSDSSIVPSHPVGVEAPHQGEAVGVVVDLPRVVEEEEEAVGHPLVTVVRVGEEEAEERGMTPSVSSSYQSPH